MIYMNIVALLVGLGPLLGWGFYPTVASKFGGKPTNQIIGSTVGTLIFAIVFNLIAKINLPTGKALIWSIISGCGWAFGQVMTFKAFQYVGSSRVMPITTAFQLLATTLWGVFALGNWPGLTNKIWGIIALLVIIIGAAMTAWQEHQSKANHGDLIKAVIRLLIGVIGYWLYSAAPQAAHINGQHAFLPQAAGMVLLALIYCISHLKKENVFREPVTYKQIISGFFFAFAALTYLISAQPQMNGLATGFVLSQTSVILATLSSVYVLHQRKTPKEMVVTVIGLILIVVSASVTVMI
ncbi:MAG: ribose transporter RbsU [Acetilactobacillus jinshanensis]